MKISVGMIKKLVCTNFSRKTYFLLLALLTFPSAILALDSDQKNPPTKKRNIIYMFDKNNIVDLNCFNENKINQCTMVNIRVTEIGNEIIELFEKEKYATFKKSLPNNPDDLIVALGLSELNTETAPTLSKLVSLLKTFIKSKTESDYNINKKKLFKVSKNLCVFSARPLHVILKEDEQNSKIYFSEWIKRNENCNGRYTYINDELTFEISGKNCQNSTNSMAIKVSYLEYKNCSTFTYSGN